MTEALNQSTAQFKLTMEIAADATIETLSAQLTNLIKENSVIMFSKTWCPFCLEMKRTLSSYGVRVAILELNESTNGALIQQSLKSITDVGTVPQLFIDGTFRADCSKLKTMEFEGDLLPVLAPHMGHTIDRGERVTSMGFLYFPESPNNVFRVSSFMVWMWCMLCIIFFRHFETRYAVLALAIDRILGFVYGGTACPIGMIATLLISRSPAQFMSGPPKHLAAFCAMFFAIFASGFILAQRMSGEGREYRVGAAVILAVFAGAAFLEWAFEFCAGCWMFGKAIEFGLVSPQVYRPSISFKVFRQWAYNFKNAAYPGLVPEGGIQRQRVALPAYPAETAVDLWVKERFDAEWKVQDYSFVRHTKVEHYSIALGCATAALMYKLIAKPIPSSTNSNQVALGWSLGFAWQVLVISSLISFFITTGLYLLRMVFYPKKVTKEWHHPIIGNYFSAISICIVLYGILYFDYDLYGGLTLVWIGGALQMLITVLKFSDLVFERTSEELINPSIMMTPVANFIVAVGFGMFANNHRGNAQQDVVNYTQLSQFWFAIAALFAIVFFTITCRKAILETWSDHRNKWSLWIWLATASIFGPAYYESVGDPSAGTGVVFQSLHYIAIFFFAIMAMGWIRGFFSYGPVFDLNMWLMPFAFSALAINTTFYYSFHQAQGLWYVLTIITVVMATVSGAVCLLHTFLQVSEKSLWLPRQKWGPLNFMKISHDAFRAALPRLEKGIQGVGASQNSNAAVNVLLEDLFAFLTAYIEHGRHEDEVIFPFARRIFPGLGRSSDAAHHAQHAQIARFVKAIEDYRASSKDFVAASTVLAVLKKEFDSFSNDVLAHLRDEERTFTPAMRKNCSLEQQIEINRLCFNATSGDSWFIVLPWIVRSLPHPEWKLRYVSTFVWANPSRAQEIGMMLYRGIDSVTWCFLANNIPAIIPRGVAGYRKIH